MEWSSHLLQYKFGCNHKNCNCSKKYYKRNIAMMNVQYYCSIMQSPHIQTTMPALDCNSRWRWQTSFSLGYKERSFVGSNNWFLSMFRCQRIISRHLYDFSFFIILHCEKIGQTYSYFLSCLSFWQQTKIC